MALSAFHDYLTRGGRIKCHTAQQRNELVEFIRDKFGIPIGHGTLNYMNLCQNGTVYKFVELYDGKDGTIISFSARDGDPVIQFEEVSTLMLLNDRTNEEFIKAFVELIG